MKLEVGKTYIDKQLSDSPERVIKYVGDEYVIYDCYHTPSKKYELTNSIEYFIKTNKEK